MKDSDFWRGLDELVSRCDLVVDRPAGSQHPRFVDFCYPLDYGYLAGTRSGDGDSIDVWLGSLPGRRVTAIICTVDLGRGDAEVKLLLGCTPAETREILAVHNVGRQSGLLIERPEGV